MNIFYAVMFNIVAPVVIITLGGILIMLILTGERR
jgi:hypothetical protein